MSTTNAMTQVMRVANGVGETRLCVGKEDEDDQRGMGLAKGGDGGGDDDNTWPLEQRDEKESGAMRHLRESPGVAIENGVRRKRNKRPRIIRKRDAGGESFAWRYCGLFE